MNKEIEKEYDNLFGENHHQICKGKKCCCHKEVKDFIDKVIKQERERILEGINDIFKQYE